MMNKKSAIAMATFAFLVFAPRMMAQDKAQPQKAPAKAAAPATTEKDQNLKEYIKLLREDVRSQKSAQKRGLSPTYAIAISERQASSPLDVSDSVFLNESGSISQPWAGTVTD
jgi:hypothetical protein